MNETQIEWYRLAANGRAFLEAGLQRAGIAARFDELPNGAPRAMAKLEVPDGEPVIASVQLQGDTVRFTGHHVVAGPATTQSDDNCNRVNLAPWGGRIYRSPDKAATDLSFGIPVPERPDQPFPFGDYMRVLFESALQLRAGQMPDYAGPGNDQPSQLLANTCEWLSQRDAAFVRDNGDQPVIVDTYTERQHPVRLELFVGDGTVWVARVHGQLVRSPVQTTRFDHFTAINQKAQAGALARDAQSQRLVATVVLWPGLEALAEPQFDWALQRALTLFDAGVPQQD